MSLLLCRCLQHESNQVRRVEDAAFPLSFPLTCSFCASVCEAVKGEEEGGDEGRRKFPAFLT